MIITVYEKRVDVHMRPIMSRYIGVPNLQCIDGELRFSVYRPQRSDWREYRIKDYFYYTVENDTDLPFDD